MIKLTRMPSSIVSELYGDRVLRDSQHIDPEESMNYIHKL